MAYDYQYLKVMVEGRLATVTIDNPPINLITLPLYAEFLALAEELAADDDLTVVVVKSADPDFFIAHFDVEALLAMPTGTLPERSTELNEFHRIGELFRSMNKVTIAQIEGRVGGGGSELAASFDMRFGVRGKTLINQMEVAVGILPGGAGTQRLPRLVGRSRALEIILGSGDLDAETAERWGYLNRLFAAEEIDGAVSALARRIASFPVEAVRLAKEAVDAGLPDGKEGLLEEAWLFQRLLGTQDAQTRMRRFLELGGQTREGELRVGELVAGLAGDAAASGSS